MKPGTKVTITTPPFAGSRRRMESETLRGTSQSARADECEKMTGASLTFSASLIVPGETCERSTSIPSRFISRTTSSPKRVSPPCRALSWAVAALEPEERGDLSLAEEARDVVGAARPRERVRVLGDDAARDVELLELHAG